MAKIKITKQEFFEETGIVLDDALPKDADSKQAERFLNRTCNQIERHIKKYNPKLFNDYNFDRMTDYQKDTIKEACKEHTLFVLNTGSYVSDANGIPIRINISKEVIDILQPLLYRGL